jgi:hypothetical protein
MADYGVAGLENPDFPHCEKGLFGIWLSVQSVGFHLAVKKEVKKEFLTDRWLWLDVKKNKTKIDITVMIDLFVCYFFE